MCGLILFGNLGNRQQCHMSYILTSSKCEQDLALGIGCQAKNSNLFELFGFTIYYHTSSC